MSRWKYREQRIKALRDDPDFRALVRLLRDQRDEQVESFVEYAERSEHFGGEVMDNGEKA
jgi:hypothetical protein